MRRSALTPPIATNRRRPSSMHKKGSALPLVYSSEALPQATRNTRRRNALKRAHLNYHAVPSIEIVVVFRMNDLLALMLNQLNVR
jgi:hypothetical protein